MFQAKKVFAVLIMVGFILGLSGTVWAEAENGKININTANMEELTQLKGVGEAIANKIIAYREANGLFSSVQDLTNVKGIGPAILNKNSDRLTVGSVKK